ncbi:FtsH protease activity modulator HflK [Coralloluteibacterium stylophorae]|uniref:Protein HflK n=1 Tax=Coralloluteibacterium stylophorae TaxID=1776034 RepID=A0AAP2CEJ4_9GAMM|nr:FtsH protease activity modulator HflK [Coralloluteibacterium stylophorae]MBS7459012.1 FtsH protease activity modulator HflK [Coralloluteibacterium stylophorae]
MAWNEPGQGKKDPWKGKNPDSEVDAFLTRLKGVFGGGRGDDGGGRSGGGRDNGFNPLWLILLLLAVWLVFDSFQLINERQRGVVLRFGEFARVMQPGANFKLPSPIETVYKVDVTSVRRVADQVRMLTRDENIVQINYEVQYTVSDPNLFLFGDAAPEETLRHAAEAAVRDVVGGSEMDSVLTGERAALAAKARELLQVSLDAYHTGIQVSTFAMPDARPPVEVRDAFDDAISAREDKERIESEARAYASTVVPEARGAAARIRTEAEGYKAAALSRAEGDAERFSLLADEYRQAPEVTRRRLYLETMQQVLAASRKVYSGDTGNVLYLPADGQAAPAGGSVSRLPAASSSLPDRPVGGSNSNGATSAPARPIQNEPRPTRGSRGEGR